MNTKYFFLPSFSLSKLSFSAQRKKIFVCCFFLFVVVPVLLWFGFKASTQQAEYPPEDDMHENDSDSTLWKLAASRRMFVPDGYEDSDNLDVSVCSVRSSFDDDETALTLLKEADHVPITCNGVVFSQWREKDRLLEFDLSHKCDGKRWIHMGRMKRRYCEKFGAKKSKAFMCELPKDTRLDIMEIDWANQKLDARKNHIFYGNGGLRKEQMTGKETIDIEDDREIVSVALIKVPDDVTFIGAQCGKHVNVHMQHAHNGDVEKEQKARLRRNLEENSILPNIHVLLLDATSRNTFMRNAPKTISLLRSLSGLPFRYDIAKKYEHFKNDLEGDQTFYERTHQEMSYSKDSIKLFDMNRLNAIGRATMDHLPQFFLGAAPNFAENVKGEKKNIEYDLFVFLRSLGYITAFTGTQEYHRTYKKFHYDHIYSFMDDAGLSWDEIPRNGESPKMIYEPFWNDMHHHCYGGEFPHRMFFNATEQFLRDYQGVPKFVVEHVLDNHVPFQNGISQIDEDLRDHIARLPLENTILYMIGDHGIHFEKYASSDRGKYEHNNPVMISSFPKKLLRAMPLWEKSLDINTDRIITLLDLHMTIREMTYPFLKKDVVERVIDISKDIKWNFPGINFLQNIIPKSRTCRDAFIPPTYCNCGRWVKSKSVSSVFSESFQKKLISDALYNIVNRGMDLSDSVPMFYSSCYIDARHASDMGLTNGTVDNQNDRHDGVSIMSAKSFKITQVEMYEENTQILTDHLFRASILAKVSTSPDNIVPCFEVIGTYQPCDGANKGQEKCLSNVISVNRMSLYHVEPCKEAFNVPKIAEFCICAHATKFA
eukprot:TRINITY_DN2223_c0_g1_i1.p1 TRINITY_DN2223_c0_g1~~TRINITY_DN2223_c0_g1_i1.p1  ORF type:complete len:825 (+),score=159.95 TRINITY_DN2223_c0_g1_i1:141-2615(+)